MASRQQLLKILQECVRLEERVIALYQTGLDDASFLSSEFLFQDKERIRMILETLKKESEAHKDFFSKLLQNL